MVTQRWGALMKDGFRKSGGRTLETESMKALGRIHSARESSKVIATFQESTKANSRTFGCFPVHCAGGVQLAPR